jgi:hypothetical protein
MKDCLQATGSHSGCKRVNQAGTDLPARVLDVGLDEASDVRLYIPAEAEQGRYATLSHCWGGKTPTMTTTQNLATHLQRIPLPLPQSFMDAVRVSRLLGIRYLWIDSLCILQDSSEDWALHAPQMAVVYGNSCVTISADAAEDSTEGFLQGSNRARYDSKAVQFACDGQEGTVWVRERGTLAYQLPYHDWSNAADATTSQREATTSYQWTVRGTAPPESALSTRGWVSYHVSVLRVFP